MKILIFPFARTMRNNKPHPKDYPWWPELISLLQQEGHQVIQVGLEGEKQLVQDFRKNLSLKDLSDLVNECDTWFSVDSFGQHFCWDLGKKGIVIFSQSDPNIFGHPENINILKSREYLRGNQFLFWDAAEYKEEAFLTPDQIFNIFKNSVFK